MAQKKKRKTMGTSKGYAAIRDALRNHPEWYQAYPLDHLMGINFGMRESLGTTIPANVAATCTTNEVMSAPDCKINVDLVVPANSHAFMESMQILMNKLRAASGSNITYDIYDLGAYTLNAREIYALYSQCRRTILATRIADLYDQDAHIKYCLMSNGRISSTLSDITQNLASDTTRLNRLANVISAMIPIRMNLLARTAWMFSNVFADSTTAKFSTKMFCLTNVTEWKIDSGRTKITGYDTDSAMVDPTLSANIAKLEDMVSQFTSNVQNSRIAGDLMKAFGAFFTLLEPVDERTRLVPIYDEAALTQIQNMSQLPPCNGSTNQSYDVEIPSGVTSIVGKTTFIPAECQCLSSAPGMHLLNSYKDSVSSAEIVSLTRLAAECEVTGSGSPYTVTLTTCGTEIVTGLNWATGMSAGAVTYTFYLPQFTAYGTTMYGCPNAGDVIDCWTRDDWAPLIVPLFTCVANTPSSPIRRYAMFDLSNWAAVDKNNLDVFHQAACLSLTATPSSIVEQSNFRFLQ